MIMAEFESQRKAVKIKRSRLNLNPNGTKWLWPNLNLGQRLLGLNGRGRI